MSRSNTRKAPTRSPDTPRSHKLGFLLLSWLTLVAAAAMGMLALGSALWQGDWIHFVGLGALLIGVAFSVEYRFYLSHSAMARPLSLGFALTSGFLIFDTPAEIWGVFSLGATIAIGARFRPVPMALYAAGRITMGAGIYVLVLSLGAEAGIPIIVTAPIGVAVYAIFCQLFEFLHLRGLEEGSMRPDRSAWTWPTIFAFWASGTLLSVAFTLVSQIAVDALSRSSAELVISLCSLFVAILLLLLAFTKEVNRINMRLNGIVNAALAMPWGQRSDRSAAAVTFARQALGDRNPRLQTSRPGQRDLGAVLESNDLETTYLVVSRPTGDLPFNTEDTEVLEALGHINRESLKVLNNERALSRDAFSDSLTGLPNFRAFQVALDNANDDRADRKGIAVLFADIDNLKRVNDTRGHEAGNELIRRTAAVIRSAVRPEDLVARVGGDEFVIIVKDVSHIEESGAIADRIVRETTAVLSTVGSSLEPTSISVGVSHSPHRESDLDSLVSEAENNMRAVKKAKKLGTSVASVLASSRQNSQVDSAVAEAIASGSISIAVQPIVDLATVRIVGFEALARLQHSPIGRISPTVLVEKAKALGLMNTLSLEVLRQALAAAEEFARLVPRLNGVSVNIELSQLQDPHLSQAIVAAGREYPQSTVILEINERSISGIGRDLSDRVESLRDAGVRIALDEYGAPASSLAAIIDLPLDFVKIDRRLVSDMTIDQRQRDLLVAFTSLAEELGMGLIVEGVEDRPSHDTLLALGVPRAQGFLYGRPVSVQVMAERLRDHGDAGIV